MHRKTPNSKPGAANQRRGVTAILAMMFMVLFGSLSAAMAIASKGNLQTAQTHLVVTRALGAADTGVRVAQSRLRAAASNFRIERGVIDDDFAERLWNGNFFQSDGMVLHADGSPAVIGVREMLENLHATDNTVQLAPDYATQQHWAVMPPIVLEQNAAGQILGATQITYIPIPGTDAVRAIVTGYAWDFMANRWITRTSQQQFRIFKRVEHAVLGPSKIMIGKNVVINGSIGATYEEVEFPEGHPVVMRSDFYGLDPDLDRKLDDFYAIVVSDDVNGDNRLNIYHPIESQSLGMLNNGDYSGDGSPDFAFADVTRDGQISDFDIFIRHYDQNGDGRLVLSAALTAGTPAQGQTPEFENIDDDLALLIDSMNPDRNGDGDIDGEDTVLGFRDGFIDYKDNYAKVRGSITIRSTRAAWEAQFTADGDVFGDYRQVVQGPIRAEPDEAPIAFGVGHELLPDVDTSTFEAARSNLASMSDGAPFTSQAGVPLVWTPVTNGAGVVVGQQFAPGIEVVVESTPFDSPAPADWYFRPVFRDMYFKDVTIPKGLNALFINCTFVGVTRVESEVDNTHPAWQFYGQQHKDGSLKFPPPPEFSDAQLDNDYYTGSLIKPADFDVPRLIVDGSFYTNTKLLSNNVRFESCTFIGSVVADKPINYTHVRNKLQFTGSTQFHRRHPDFPDDPAWNPKASNQAEIDKSAMLLPHYSVDIGKNNADPDQDVNLNGLIIAGVLDVRGNTSINGALLLTFQPSIDDPALQHFGFPAGNPANFNITLGYFGTGDGDEEGLAPFEYNGQMIVGFDIDGDGYVDTTEPGQGDPVPFNGYGRIVINWDPNLLMPDGLVSPIAIEPVLSTYREGRINPQEFNN